MSADLFSNNMPKFIDCIRHMVDQGDINKYNFNNISNKKFKQFIRVLNEKSEKIKRLNLSELIDVKFTDDFFKYIVNTEHLQVLTLTHCSIPLEHLFACLLNNKSVQCLILQDYIFSAKEQKALNALMTTNKSILRLDLSYCVLHKLPFQFLKTNTTLKQLILDNAEVPHLSTMYYVLKKNAALTLFSIKYLHIHVKLTPERVKELQEQYKDQAFPIHEVTRSAGISDFVPFLTLPKNKLSYGLDEEQKKIMNQLVKDVMAANSKDTAFEEYKPKDTLQEDPFHFLKALGIKDPNNLQAEDLRLIEHNMKQKWKSAELLTEENMKLMMDLQTKNQQEFTPEDHKAVNDLLSKLRS